MLHTWQGRKPHVRAVMGEAQEGKRPGVTLLAFHPGEVFEPTAAELQSFGDLLTPVAEGLRVAEVSEGRALRRQRAARQNTDTTADTPLLA